MNRDMTPGPPEGQEPIEQLFRDVSALAEETARRITDAEVNARLDQLLRKTGHAAPPAPEPDPASDLNAARAQAEEIIANARRAAAETAAEAACAAQSAADAARREAERIIAEAEEYSDTALRRAAAIIAGARGQAASIIADARERADQIVADARLQAVQADGRARRPALTGTRISGARPDDAEASVVHAMLYYAAVVFGLVETHDRLPLPPPLVDRGTADNKPDVTFGSHVLKFSLDAPDARETRGWVRRKSARAWMQPVPSNSTTCPLVLASADGIVILYVNTPDDDAHVPDFLWLTSGHRLLETTGGEQPASQAGGLIGIHGTVAARSIESSYQPPQIPGSQHKHMR